jgi:hypothetical protein
LDARIGFFDIRRPDLDARGRFFDIPACFPDIPGSWKSVGPTHQKQEAKIFSRQKAQEYAKK